MTNIVWLRRDLQLEDNASIFSANQAGGQIQPVFVFDKQILARFSNKQDRRLTFLANALHKIDTELRQKNSRLLVLYGNATEILPRLAKLLDAKIFAGEDYEPSTIKRDEIVAANAPLTLSKQHLILAPQEVAKPDGTAYKVFTPYSKAWQEKLTELDHTEFDNRNATYADFAKTQAALAGQNLQILDASNPAEMLAEFGYEYVDDKIWQVEKAQQMLQLFIAEKIEHYATNRDIPAIYGTSRLSPYLRFGLVTIRQAYNAAIKAKMPTKWISELIWREFYVMILWHFPDTPKLEFQEHYRQLNWARNDEFIERWKTGNTGYPIVDAGMRELVQTGWMHNRVRMIVGSFFTKNLLQDWRIGEEFFAQYLMDYDQASNVGGWQWCSSTGTDAAPYFRMFNPVLQSQKFDPDGEYIRRYVPELALLPSKDLHAPWEKARPANYAAPVADHSESRAKVMEFFKIERVNS